MNNTITLRGMTWNHSRGYTSMVATAQRFHERFPHVEIQWSKRSLQEFADSPIDTLAEQFDFLVIDHPWAGFAAASGILEPLETLLPNDFMADQAAHSVGQSHQSYQFDDSQWALAIDAACPVSASRPDLLQKANTTLPSTFDELISLGKRGLVCCPSIPLDVYGNFLNLLKAAGETIFATPDEIIGQEAGLIALEQLKELASVVPDIFFELNPIQTLEVMSTTHDFAYAPYTYGYTNYSRKNYAPYLISFGDVIGMTQDKPGSTMLGGTGIAITKNCQHTEIAAQYVQYVADKSTQAGLFFDAGGQPGHRSAWTNPELDARCDHFFSNTLDTLDRAFVRPRYCGYLDFQDNAGYPIHDFLRNGGNAKTLLEKLNQMYRESHRASA